MRTRRHDGLEIGEIGVGVYGLSGAYGAKDRSEYARTLERAVELGVTFFDAAAAYGEAEAFLGGILAPHGDRVRVATKVGLRGGRTPDLSPAWLRESCERSLAALRCEAIDLYQVHFDDPATPPEEAVATLERLREEGKIRRWGLGHLSPERLRTWLAAGRPFSILMELSAAARDNRARLLPLARKAGVAAIAFSVTGRGLLTGAVGPDTAFAGEDIRAIDPLFAPDGRASALRVAGALAAVAEPHGRTPAQAAIAWVLAQPGVLCALVGPSAVNHLEEDLAASGWELTDDELASLEAGFAREDAWLGERQVAGVRRILDAPVGGDAQAAFAELVQAFEGAIARGLVAEEAALPLFHELFALRRRLDESDARESLDAVRRRLRDLVEPT